MLVLLSCFLTYFVPLLQSSLQCDYILFRLRTFTYSCSSPACISLSYLLCCLSRTCFLASLVASNLVTSYSLSWILSCSLSCFLFACHLPFSFAGILANSYLHVDFWLYCFLAILPFASLFPCFLSCKHSFYFLIAFLHY